MSYILPGIIITILTACAIVYTYTIIQSVQESPVKNILFVLSGFIMFGLFLWSFIKLIITKPLQPPEKYKLNDEQVEKLNSLLDDEEKSAFLERIVVDQDLEIITCKPAGFIRYCHYCKLIKPDRSHHCSKCGICVLKMDHHCPWVNNCVGYSNYKFFVLSCFYALIVFIFYGITLSQYFIDIWDNYETYGLSIAILVTFVIILCFGLINSIFLIFHIGRITKNQTTIEHLYPTHFLSKRFSFNIKTNYNFKEVFGDDWKLWALPIFSSRGNGYEFPHKVKRVVTSRTLANTSAASSIIVPNFE